MRIIFAGTILALLPIASACGPMQSTMVIWQADAELAGARAADAEKSAPYEMTAAGIYLDKALEEQSYADFDPAIVYGTKARDMARKARDKAAMAKRRGEIPVTAPPTSSETGMAAEPTQQIRVVPVPE